MLQEGALLAGKYRVERMLGAGGMGYVVAAIHEALDQRVAVKVLASELCENKDAVTRFLREARAAVRIQSEHVARVLDVGETEQGVPYMVMEFLDGNDLSRELDARLTLEIPIAIDYVLQACEAVAEAHSLGVIHRDLKPANLFLTRRPDGTPFVKVLDFGISKAISPDSALEPAPSLTATQSLLGSPAYMSPEQVRRPKTVDTRTDVWSFGTVLFEFLTGAQPFVADTPLAVLAAVVSDPAPSVRERRPEIPVELESVVARCLEKNPDNRYQTVAELANALAPYAASASLPSISRISGILRASLAPAQNASTTLKSASGPAIASSTARVASISEEEAGLTLPQALSVEAASADKQTQTGFGLSQASEGRPRRKAALAIGIGAVGVLLVGFAVLRSGSQQERPGVGAAPPLESAKAAIAEAPSPPPPAAAPAIVPAESAAPEVAKGALAAGAAARPAEAPKPKVVRKVNAPGSGAPQVVPALPRPEPAAKPAAPAAAEDPLDGRR